ncbi:hypothetical protein SCUCBS95973_004950 [Sporothrix curviconia]|uniref:C6 zinc finger domain containing protein n=1 Tax=Sporothrix curviconia TaxID=1260050 RepID=A0ABP0BSQ4_9PEZI
MSAAFLASRDPNVRQPALRLMRRAADYAQVELGMMRMAVHPSENRNGSMALPTGLLFSLFGLGTTVCWVDARSLGLPFFRETRRLLARLNRQQRISPGAVDAERLEFFNKCMTYCDMLLSVVHDDVVADKCLEEQLLDAEIEVPTVPDPDAPNSLRSLGDTGDSRTPPSHLALIAEAYRLSSLLVLYETFPSLGFLRLPGRAPTEGGGCLSNAVSDAFSLSLAGSPAVLWQEWITPLSLHLLQVLERIPPTSGSRVIQPLLYICASTGLRQPDMTVEAELAKVSQGRNFIMQRLTILESSLPPTPVRVAKELVRAIWRAHDATPPGTTPVHWINVMEVNDLRSMFG